MDNQIPSSPLPLVSSQPVQPISNPNPPPSKDQRLLLAVLATVLALSIGINALQYLGYIDNFRGIHKYLPSWTNIPQVKDYGFYYYIETNLRELKDVSGQNLPGNIEVITEIQGPKLPKFYLGTDTDVFINENNTFKKVGQGQLKPGQRIGILFNYYRLERWGLPRITILP